MEAMNQNEKEKAIHLALQSIEKQFGKGSIMRMDEKEANKIS